MADNAFVKIGTALLKHQVKKLVGEEAMGAIGEVLAEIGEDKLASWRGNKSTVEAIEKAATTARDLFRGKVNDDEVEQGMVMLPIHDLLDNLGPGKHQTTLQHKFPGGGGVVPFHPTAASARESANYAAPE